MPATPRPRGFTGASASSSRPSTNTPMSERQQMALLMQMTSSSNQSDMTGHSPARSRDRNERGETALHVAAIKGDQDTIKKLLDQGMNPNVIDFAGWSPLHEACNHGHYNVAQILIKAGANINAKGLDDNTPLHDAATVGHLKLVKMLVEKGADLSIKNRKGKTACDVAVSSVYNFLQQAKDSSNNRASQQIKKGGGGSSGGGVSSSGGGSGGGSNNNNNTDAKTKSLIDDNEDATCNSTGSGTSSGGGGVGSGSSNANQSSNTGANQNLNSSNLNLKDDDDIYEFKTTPKDVLASGGGGSGDDKADGLLGAGGTPNSSGTGTNVQTNTISGNNSNSNASSSGLTSGSPLNIKNLDKNSQDDKSGGGGGDEMGSNSVNSGNLLNINSTNQSKRTHSDIENADESTFNIAEDETKRKKRKETATEAAKDSTKTASGTRGGGVQSARQDKNTKVIGTAAKAIGLAGGKSSQIDRKSPCASPKPAASKSTDSDAELEIDSKNNESFGGGSSGGGPKVPPLKIVIPPQNTAGDQDVCIRNGKNASTRNHPALPYVVASSNSGNDLNVEKESSSSRCASPTEAGTGGGGSGGSGKSNDNEKQTKIGANSSAEERAQQRVLRSSHRSGGASSGQSVDRGSNNSSPQLQSSSPSPAPATGTGGSNNSGGQCGNGSNSGDNGNVTGGLQNSNSSNTSSPTTQPQHNTDSDTTVRNAPSPVATATASTAVTQNTVELHPRKRKIRTSKEDTKSSQAQSNTSTNASSNESEKESIPKDEIQSHDQPMTNCYQMYLNIRKQIERRQRNLFPVQPKPPQGFKDYLMNRGTYVLSGKTSEPALNFPANLAQPMRELYSTQEKERHKLKMQHVVEKEKLVLAVEQEILRVHGRAARALANQSLPFSVCTILKDEEVYNMITPEQEEKDRNARSRYNGRLFLSWLQDVDDKWEKIKEAMLFRHHNEVESLHAVQKMDWEWKMKELLLCEYKAKPVIDEQHVPIVHVSDDFDLLPA